MGLDETIDATWLGNGRQLDGCSPLPLCPFGGIAIIWVLKALRFFPVSPHQTRRQSSSEPGFFNLEEHLTSKLTLTPSYLCGNWKGRWADGEGGPSWVKHEKWGSHSGQWVPMRFLSPNWSPGLALPTSVLRPAKIKWVDPAELFLLGVPTLTLLTPVPARPCPAKKRWGKTAEG